MWLLIAVLVSVLAVSPLIVVAVAAALSAMASWRRGPGRRRGTQRPTHVNDVVTGPRELVHSG
jgi:hypothetical protein